MDSYPMLLDPALPEIRIDFGIAEAEFARQRINSATAAQIAGIHSVLSEARAYPAVFVGPHADPDNREHVEFAERAAIADLAVRLSLAENTIRSQAAQAQVMIARTPRTWELFRDGEVSPANARVAADLAATLPNGAHDLFERFDTAVAQVAATLAPARFATRARVIREKVHAEAAAARHRTRMQERRVSIDPDIDGMAWFSAYLPGDLAAKAMAGLDAEALRLFAAADETRTIDQIRADIVGDLLTGAGTASPIGVRVGVTVPVMTLLGLSEEPGSLEGFGPIDAETARRLTAASPTFYRILTHPITGTILDIDRTTLRVPADMRRWLEHRDQVCTFPGCGRSARNCDLDHTIDRQYGGTTRVSNLAHLCRNHHRDKHRTRWRVDQRSDGTIEWTSPTGYTRTSDPPPF